MPRFVSLYSFFLVIVFIYSSAFSDPVDLQFSKAQVLADMQSLENSLHRNHPNLYLYTSPEAFKKETEKWQAQLPEQMNGPQAYSALARYSTLIKDGHTLFYPGELISQAAQDFVFPFRIYIDQGKLFTEHNYSSKSNLPDGSEILSINQLPAAELLSFLQERMMRDGNNYNYANWVLHNYFSSYYGFCFGNPSEFEIAYVGPSGERQELKVKAEPSAKINALSKERYPNFKKLYQQGPGQGIILQLKPESKTAILTIRDFHQSILKKTYKQHFKKTIANYFAQLSQNKTEKLIIDLRNNQGGKVAYSQFLLQHLLPESFQLLASYARVDKKNLNDLANRLKLVKGENLGDHQPKEMAFAGELIVLINGGSFSNAGIFCSALEKYQRATFIGAETGGSAYILSSAAKRIVLPNTKIVVEVPKLRYTMKEVGADGLQGIRPTIFVQPTIKDLIQQKDVVLEEALKWWD